MGSVKHTPTAPESVDGQVIFKDILITQSTVKIRRKLQKWAFGPNQDLESLLKTATTVFYNRDEEGRKEQDRRERQKVEALATALQGVSLQVQGTGSRKARPGVCFLCSKEGHSKWDCAGRAWPPKPCPLCKGDHWKWDCPQRHRQLGSGSQNQDQD